MKWCFLVRGRDQGRIQARTLQVVERQLLQITSIVAASVDQRLSMSFVLDANDNEAFRIKALLWRIQGVEVVEAFSEESSIRRAIAFFRVGYDAKKRIELLAFLSVTAARVLVDRPLLLVFEIVGTPDEVENIYRSTLQFGPVECVSSSCIFLPTQAELQTNHI